ncbi:hypothetical protein DFH29DRAFT_979646 [Suillus ampliporus]|nr:hypothetical protein DFH29DRAFT_979646 [Suillus ampliporus]
MCSWIRPARRFFSTSSLNLPALDAWIASPKSLVLADTFHSTHLSDLYITLPTRDGTRALLRNDGTDANFCPPEPFTRRMWASGSMTWNKGGELKVGEKATAVSTVAKVEKKGFEAGKPMVFVKQRIEVTVEGRNEPGMVEERAHVYQLQAPSVASVGSRVPREVKGLPKSEFSFSYTPTLTTLFRFSALTFNGHHIHIDKDYAQKVEGYPERLVHGPLTALMLLESLIHHRPSAQLRNFTYRAHNPIFVNCAATIHGAIVAKDKAELWCENDEGVVGMTGVVQFDE